MSKLDETRKKGTQTLIALAVIAVAVYIGFTPLYELITPNGGVAGAVVGSSFGAIFVIILTMYLLNKQTEIEQESKKSERIFDEKVKLYYDIYNEIESMLKDGCISKDEEMKKLPFVMARLVTIGSDEVIKAFTEIFSLIVKIYKKEESQDSVEISADQEGKMILCIVELAKVCRLDLGISDVPIDSSLMESAVATVDSSNKIASTRNKPIEGAPKTYAEKVIDGCKYNINRYDDTSIRIYKDGVYFEGTVKTELGIINEALDLNIDTKAWGNTRTAGYKIIKAINSQKET